MNIFLTFQRASALKSHSVILAQRSTIARKAQEMYDAWDEEDRDTYAGGGICHIIADEIVGILDHAGIPCTSVTATHEQHVYVVAQCADGVFEVNIPHFLYESGGGFSWEKIPGVTFDAGDVVVDHLDSDPNSIGDYIEDFEPDQWAPVDDDDETATVKPYPPKVVADAATLLTYYAKLGFKRIGRSSDMIRKPSTETARAPLHKRTSPIHQDLLDLGLDVHHNFAGGRTGIFTYTYTVENESRDELETWLTNHGWVNPTIWPKPTVVWLKGEDAIMLHPVDRRKTYVEYREGSASEWQTNSGTPTLAKESLA